MQLQARDPRVHKHVETYKSAFADKRHGRIDDAVAKYRRILKGGQKIKGEDRHSLLSVAFHQLSDMADDGFTDAEFALAEDVAAATQEGSEAGWTIRFALGQASMRHDAGTAMRWFDEGNRMRRAAIAYDADQMDAMFGRLTDVFDPEIINRLSEHGGRSPKPIFIVGMPRSGTTLVEQVLASVPGVFGAGELTVVPQLARDISQKEGDWPNGAANLSPQRARGLANHYLVHIHRLAPQAERVVDKMPANAQNVGLILSLFPGATVIHMRRDPMDNCFGCYRQLFSGRVDYCYDQTELGRYHHGLMRSMNYWREAMPGRIVDVDYRRLVEHFEPEARRIVAATGMEWTDACLEFHKTEREINTASSKQARQPLFSTGIGSAEPYRPYLAELEAALAS